MNIKKKFLDKKLTTDYIIKNFSIFQESYLNNTKERLFITNQKKKTKL